MDGHPVKKWPNKLLAFDAVLKEIQYADIISTLNYDWFLDYTLNDG